MEITQSGDSSFLIKGEKTAAINPPDKAPDADVVLFTERKRRPKLIVNGPGEYEIRGVLIASLALGDVLAHAVEVDGINVLCLPDSTRRLAQRDIEVIGPVDVLLISAADAGAAQAAMADLSPRVVIPFGAQAEALCSAVGVKEVTPQARFSWNGVSTAPKAVLLKSTPARKRAA